MLGFKGRGAAVERTEHRATHRPEIGRPTAVRARLDGRRLGGVHLDQGYVNDVCLTPRFNQCVFYEDELTRE